ncbi:hypothetical protein [Pseudoxanthomonas sp. Root630]|uniref:hypothetical protein n=1 Tax=Pseudoxanthomonas sp. Root630 TaxID=1736574 RepID=UPI0007027713|nr:hypothetical protein [Pseudoxanthomonas sp. Root630]KRA41895.1 hypothetical protein ASD72_15025 [Pseudoxanthomonas sp. Root630]
MKFNCLALAALTTLALSACLQHEETAPAADAPAAEAPADTATATDAATDATAIAASDTVNAGTGVAECDQYLEKVYACISDKVPEAQRDMMKQGIEQSKAGWAAVTDKSALAAQCKTAMDQAKTAYAAMGCSF